MITEAVVSKKGAAEHDLQESPRNADLLSQPLTDSGNGERFVKLHGRDVRYCPEYKAWLVWDRRPAVEPYLFGILLLFVAACGGVLLARPGLRNLQVSFFFFSISVGALTSQARVRRGLSWALLFGICFTLVIYTAGHHQLPVGIRLAGLEGDDADYRSFAAWARDHTPADAVFLVPPDEESFRLHARRAIVANFKGVPQLSAELPEWRDRLLAVLDLKSTQDLLALPQPMGRTLRAIRSRYDALPPEQLFAVARKYGARYVILTHPAGDATGAALAHSDTNHHYFLYDLNPGPRTLNP